MRRPSLGVTAVIIAALLLALSARNAFAQQAVTSATLSGSVVDTRGRALPATEITVTSIGTNRTWTTRSDSQGYYRFIYLPVGAYRLRASQPGFDAFEQLLTLSVGQALDVRVRLDVRVESQTVQVQERVPVVEVIRTQVAETITPREVDSLPLNGRNYLDLALLSPAVSRTNTGNNERFAETSAVPGTGISIAGQRNLNSGFVLDGLSANDDAADLAGTYLSEEVIREFQVVSSGGIAEFGRASGGIVNVVTRSGANDWRGRLYGFLRSRRLDARNPLATSKDPLTQSQYGLTLGGPLKHDRSFLFSNFEQMRQNRAGIITIAPANVAAVNGVLDSVGYRGQRIHTGEFPTGFDGTNYLARLDHRLSESNSLYFRYSIYDITSPNSRNTGGLNSVSRGTGLDNRDQTWALNDTATLSPNTVNEARFQYTRSRLAAPVNDSIGPAINISGTANFGTATFSPTARDIDLYQFVNNVSLQRGEHFVKVGADFLYNRVDIDFPGALQGVYTFSSLANLQQGRYINFQQAFGEPDQFQSNPNLSLFIQDEWRPRKNLTINAGMRYEVQWLPAPIQTDTGNFAPRIGIAYAPGERRTVIRAGFGIFYDRVPLRATSNALQRDGINYRVALLSFGQEMAPVFPSVLSSFPQGLLTNITTIDPRIQNGAGAQANLQVEREVVRNTSLSLGYIYLRGTHIIMSRNVNVPTVPAAEAARLGIPNLGRPDPRFGNIGQFEGAGDSYYNGMTISLNRRAAGFANVRVAYTLSKAIDNAGNFFFSTPQNNFDIRDDRGLSANDQRHRLVVSGSFETPGASGSGARRAFGGLQLSYIFSCSSAQPFNIQTGADRNNDTSVNDRPAGVGRNTGRGFNFASLELRLARKFRVAEHLTVEAMAEAFDVLNRANYQFPNNIIGTGAVPSPSFGRATAAADPRQIQFGLRLSF